MCVTTDRSREAAAFLATIADAPPDAVSACDGWTTHEIAAHVTGIHAEVIRHLEPFLQGDPVPKTRSFEAREAPLQATDHAELLELLDVEENRMRQLVDDIIDQQPETVIPWTGRHMAVAKFIPHLRNEHALHRWDIAGDDDTSTDYPTLDLDPASRHLFIWGRRPDDRSRLRSHLDQPDLARLQTLLSGY
jgi:hypothetical protein